MPTALAVAPQGSPVQGSHAQLSPVQGSPVQLSPVQPYPAPGRAALPPVRVQPAPRLEPPADDELTPAPVDAAWLAAGRSATAAAPASVALPLDLPTRAPDSGRAVAPAVQATPARLATQRFLGVCLEVLGGFRPVTHLRPLCSASQFAEVAKHLTGRTTATPAGRPLGAAHIEARTPVVGRHLTGAPPRGGRTQSTGPGERIRVRRVIVCEPGPGVAEASVVLGRHETVWAVALRLEEISSRWVCTYLRVL
jgi:hypothetical protein